MTTETQSALVAQLLAEANASAETGLDMNEVVSGGQGARLLPQGYALVRLVEYTEFGNQPQEFAGAAKDPAPEVQLGFALFGTAPNGELYHTVEKDGTLTPYILRLFPFALKQNDRARSYSLFKLLNWDGKAKSFGQLLGKAWVVKIVHEARSKTDATLVSRIDVDTFLPPLDPVSQAPYPVPMPEDKYFRVFLWDRPTKAAWDALYIEPTEKVKNFVQDKIMSATNYEGSPLQQLLSGANLALPGAVAGDIAQPVAQPTPAPVQPVAAVPVQPVAQPVQPAVAAAPAVAVPATPLAQPVQAAVAPVQPIAPIAPVQPVMPV